MDRPTHCSTPRVGFGQRYSSRRACCAQPPPARQPFVDDAQRRVSLPANVERVFAAGAPAEVLLYTLVPDKLAGPQSHVRQPRRSSSCRRSFVTRPPSSTCPTATIRATTPSCLRSTSTSTSTTARSTTTTWPRSKRSANARVYPASFSTGDRAAIPDVYRRLGAAFGVAERGERLADEAQRLIDKYRGMLGARAVARLFGVLAERTDAVLCGPQRRRSRRPAGRGQRGGPNRCGARRPLTVAEIRDLAPDVVIAANPAAAAAIRSDPAWQAVTAVAAGRVHAPPTLPFNWGPRPPSVNRVAGLIWMAYALPGRAFDAAYFDDVRSLFATFYHVTPSTEQLRALTLESN